jgi:uncharacterized damage-inducible protein DinB
MLTDAQRQACIDQIRQLPAQIADLVRDLTPEQLTAHPIPGEWSVAQNVHHLADSHMNCYIRCKLIATEENPPLKPYNQDTWAAFPDAQSADISTSLALLTHLHVRWVLFWEALPSDAWPRPGFHLENGPVTLDTQLQLYADHGLAHVDQITRTLAAEVG